MTITDEIKIKEIEIEKEIKENEKPIETEQEQEEKIEEPKKSKEEKKKSWEDFLGRKLVTEQEYEKLKRSERIFKVIKYFGLAIFIIILLSLFLWFILEFKEKTFLQSISIFNNNTNYPTTNVQAPIQLNNTNNPNIYLNISINIDKIITNES